MDINSVLKIIEEKKTYTERDKVTYDDLISSAGELGWYQWRLFLSTSPFCAIGVFAYISQLFITDVSPNHWCSIPQLANFTEIERRNLGVPKDETSRFGYSQCNMYVANWTEVLITGQKPNQSWSTVPCQYGWEFNTTEIPYATIGSDLEWVCEKNSYQTTAQAIFFVGCIFGSLIFGWIADRYGRLVAIICSCLISCVGGVLSIFTKNLSEFSAARFVLGLGYDSCINIAYILLLEYIGPKYRTLLGNLLFALLFPLFMTIFPWIALVCGNWKTLCIVTSLPSVLALFTKLFLPESPMWLLSKGKIDEAINRVLAVSKINKKKVPQDLINQFKLQVSNSQELKNTNHSWLEIFRRPLIRKMYILVGLEQMCVVLLFDGFVRTTRQLDFNFFVSFSITSFAQCPAMLIVAFIMDFTGRRWLCIIVMAIGSICCFVTLCTTGILSIFFAVVARFAVHMANGIVQQWAPEILPTSVRGSGVAFIHIFAFVASFISPYVVYLEVFYYWLPLAIMGVISALGMIIAFGIPETARKAMPNTFEDSERLTQNQRIWSLPSMK